MRRADKSAEREATGLGGEGTGICSKCGGAGLKEARRAARVLRGVLVALDVSAGGGAGLNDGRRSRKAEETAGALAAFGIDSEYSARRLRGDDWADKETGELGALLTALGTVIAEIDLEPLPYSTRNDNNACGQQQLLLHNYLLYLEKKGPRRVYRCRI